MTVTRESSVVSFDAGAALDAALDADADHVRVCVEYDVEDWELLYVADHVLEAYEEGEAALSTKADDLHSYIHLDFTERELFEELAPRSGDVVAYVTRMENHSLVRFLSGREGLFLSLDRRVDLDAVLDAVEAAIW